MCHRPKPKSVIIDSSRLPLWKLFYFNQTASAIPGSIHIAAAMATILGPQGTARAEGIAPASVGLKYHFIDSLGWQQPSVGAIVRFFLRSGTRNFKTTRATSDFRIVADWDFLPQWSLNPNVGVALYESDASHLYAAGLFLATLNYNPSKTRISSSTPASSLLKQDTGKSPSLSISVRPMSSAGTSSSTSVPGHGSQAKRRRGCFCRPASASGFDRRVLHGTGSLDQSLVAASAPSLSSG